MRNLQDDLSFFDKNKTLVIILLIILSILLFVFICLRIHYQHQNLFLKKYHEEAKETIIKGIEAIELKMENCPNLVTDVSADVNVEEYLETIKLRKL